MSTATPATASPDRAASADNSVWSMVKQTFKDFNEDNALRLAAAMACYIMLALAPMLVIFVKVIGVIYKERTDDVVKAQLDQLVGPAGGQAIGEMIKNAHQSGGGTLATIVSFAIVIFSASGVFVSLQDALNTIWEVKPKPNAGWWQWIRKRFLSIGMVFGIAILLLVSMAITSVLHVMIDSVFGAQRTGFFAKAGAYVVDFVVTVAVAWVLFMGVFKYLPDVKIRMGVFKYLPDVKIRWKDVWVGALVTAVLFKVGQIIMAIYFAKGSATSAYGTFGSIVAVLLWAYYSSIILFVGAEFTQVWAKAHGREIEPEEHAVRVTEGERAQQGIPSRDRVGALPAGSTPNPTPPRPLRPAPTDARTLQASDDKRPYAFGAAGAAAGAVAAGLATWYIDQKRLTRKQATAVQLEKRIGAIEAKVGRVNRLKHYLEQLEVKDRIDRVEREIRRAGTHVRAEETGRPRWMVRLGDLVGGRWSNL
jgi:membrane protein